MIAPNKETRWAKYPLQSEAGFTLLDLIVTTFLLSIVGWVGLPRLSELSDSFNRLNARSVFVQDVKRAQAQALTEGCRGIFEIANGGNTYSFGCDYLSYDTSATPSADAVTFQRILPERVTIAMSSQIIFNSRGQSVDKDDIISNVTVTFTQTSGGETNDFSTGTLLGTGLFSFN